MDENKGILDRENSIHKAQVEKRVNWVANEKSQRDGTQRTGGHKTVLTGGKNGQRNSFICKWKKRMDGAHACGYLVVFSPLPTTQGEELREGQGVQGNGRVCVCVCVCGVCGG